MTNRRRRDVTVSEADWLALRFEEKRAVAYQMLGSLSDADDAEHSRALLVLAVTDLHLSAEDTPVFIAMAALGSACALATLWLARRQRAEPEASLAE
jgi:hypothetical protein